MSTATSRVRSGFRLYHVPNFIKIRPAVTKLQYADWLADCQVRPEPRYIPLIYFNRVRLVILKASVM